MVQPSSQLPTQSLVYPPIGLVVSDIDGTLITQDQRITDRLYSCLQQLEDNNIPLILATGRPPRWIIPVIEQIPQNPLCICANGAVVWDSSVDSIIHAAQLQPQEMFSLHRDMHRQNFPFQWSVAVERAGISAYDQADKLFATAKDYYHAWSSDEHSEQEIDDLLAEPAVKMLIRARDMPSSELYELLRPLVPADRMTLTYSWEGSREHGALVEISAVGVSKGKTLEYLATHYGDVYPFIRADRALAFGDMPNDYDMLSWAVMGVAMGQAPADLLAVAQKQTTTPENNGVAAILEEILSVRY